MLLFLRLILHETCISSRGDGGASTATLHQTRCGGKWRCGGQWWVWVRCPKHVPRFGSSSNWNNHKNLVVSGFQVVVMGVLVIIPGRLLSFRNFLRIFHDLSMGPLKVSWSDSLVKRETPSPTKVHLVFLSCFCFYFMDCLGLVWFWVGGLEFETDFEISNSK